MADNAAKVRHDENAEKVPKYLEKNYELDFDIDIDDDREELQMPELSKGKYLHDFKVYYMSINYRDTISQTKKSK